MLNLKIYLSAERQQIGCMLLCRQCILESPLFACGFSLSLEEKILTHAAACCSLLSFGYVTKPKIESSFTAEQRKRFKFINSNNKGQHYAGFSRVGGGREIMPASSGSDLTLAGAGIRRQASTVMSWACFPSWPPSLLLPTVSPLLGHGKATEPLGKCHWSYQTGYNSLRPMPSLSAFRRVGTLPQS